MYWKLSLSRAALLYVLAAHAPTMAHAWSESPEIRTSQGIVRGYIEESTGHHVFLGVPYADTTAGKNRWAPPQPAPWRNEVFDATQFSPTCPQWPVDSYMTSGIGEDCLSLNIWAPVESKGKHLPVLVYNYGGAMVSGSNSNPIYNGSAFATSGFVYVALNHRSGMFGFPHGRTFNGTSQNFGILDVFAALHWVQENIHAFGGSPEEITFMGQSSGGVMVDHYLWNHPETKIKATIIHSADTFSGPGYAPEGVGFDVLSGEVGCPTDDDQAQLDCLRNKTVTDLMTDNWKAKYQPWFVPVIDGHTRYQDYPARFKAGKYPTHVPVLTGNVDHEETLFGLEVYPASETTPFSHWINTFDADAAHVPDNELLAHYPDSDFTSTALQSGQLYADLRFYCAIDYMVNLRADLGNHYRFRWMGNWTAFEGNVLLGAAHGSELPFIFQQYNATLATGVQPKLAKQMHEMWVNFAKKPQNGPGWPATTKHGGIMALLGQNDAPLDVTLTNASEYNSICQNFLNAYQPAYPVLIDPRSEGAY
ncbi:acetylcholinesterase precursor [Naematelia encephala]|uniref:Acetylcholinesterase n=1 Tax=Naematelia encephala TaxID=71784 RepID=A0A1Y2AW39_9TREE|nr:acetylcholinesterase precursor [Naematelia encephala]